MEARVSIYRAKAGLSKLLRIVRDGQPIVITDRNTPIARLVPYREEPADSLDSRIDELIARGEIARGEIPPSETFSTSRTRARRRGALRRFLADRG